MCYGTGPSTGTDSQEKLVHSSKYVGTTFLQYRFTFYMTNVSTLCPVSCKLFKLKVSKPKKNTSDHSLGFISWRIFSKQSQMRVDTQIHDWTCSFLFTVCLAFFATSNLFNMSPNNKIRLSRRVDFDNFTERNSFGSLSSISHTEQSQRNSATFNLRVIAGRTASSLLRHLTLDPVEQFHFLNEITLESHQPWAPPLKICRHGKYSF